MKMPSYSDYKDSGVDWLGMIPSEWKSLRLKFAAPLQNRKIEAINTKLPYVGMENVESGTGRFIESEEQLIAEGMSNHFQKSDVLFGKLRPYLAKALLTEWDGVCSSEFLVLRGAHVTPEFLHYYVLFDEFIKQVDSSTYGSKMPRASWDFIGNMMIPIPSMSEQRAISSFLDRETEKLDTLIAKQERLIELAQEKRQAIISHAVTKGLNSDIEMTDCDEEWLQSVPSHWEIIRLGALFREINESGHEDLPILQVSIHHGVSDRQLDDDETDKKVVRSEDKSKYKKVQPKDLVYNMMRAWQGGFGTVTVTGMVSPAYVVARPQKQISTEFIEQLLRTPNAIEKIRLHSRGVTDFRLRLYWDEFKSIKVALPPKEEQEEIMSFVKGEIESFEVLTSKCRRNIELMREHRTALISAAVTGKIDVREAA